MIGSALLAVLLAVIPPPGPPASAASSPPASPAASPPPSVSASPRTLRTIVTVVSSPYCNSLATHFNGALVPMLANDRTLDGVSVQLDDINTLFDQPDYVERYLHVRDALGKQVDELNESLHLIQLEIDALRDGEHLTTDTQSAADIHVAAEHLQNAYDKQRQLSIDLSGIHYAMMQYNIERAHPSLGGFSEAEMTEPQAMRDIKDYLRFNNQRAVIASNEDVAVDVALNAAQDHCMK
jgi:hypothetical protein